MSLASISIVGNLTKAPEQLHLNGGHLKSTFYVAVNNPPRGNKTSETANFYRVEVWGKLAELAGKYLDKGNQVGVSGRFVLEHWTDREGKERVSPIVEATQLSLPPRLKVVSNDQQGAPISGELELSESDLRTAEPFGDYAYPESDVHPDPNGPVSTKRRGRKTKSA